jgi:DNA-3-methyladenine glycosylase II
MLPLKPPFDFARSIRFWRRSTGELCEHTTVGVYRRVVLLDNRLVVLTLRSSGVIDAPIVAVELDGRAPEPAELAQLDPVVRWLLGDDTDLGAFYGSVATDPPLAGLAGRLYGLRAPRAPLWETLVWTICGQQISVAFAYVLKERLVQRYGEPFEAGGRTLYRFPSPDALAAADPADLTAMQFSRNKAGFITDLAQQIVSGRFDLDRLPEIPTNDAVAYLSSFRGIGPWTAEFLLLRALGRTDVFPAADAGLRQAVTRLYGTRLAEPALRAFAGPWGAWRGLVALYLLASLRDDE